MMTLQQRWSEGPWRPLFQQADIDVNVPVRVYIDVNVAGANHPQPMPAKTLNLKGLVLLEWEESQLLLKDGTPLVYERSNRWGGMAIVNQNGSAQRYTLSDDDTYVKSNESAAIPTMEDAMVTETSWVED
jgi:hypothetical protein